MYALGLNHGVPHKLRRPPDEGQKLVVVQAPHAMRSGRLKPEEQTSRESTVCEQGWVDVPSANPYLDEEEARSRLGPIPRETRQAQALRI